jgi:hypothetical protein
MKREILRGRALYAIYVVAALATLLYTVGAPWDIS